MSTLGNRLVAVVAMLVLGASALGLPAGVARSLEQSKTAQPLSEGPSVTGSILVGPFDLHRKYESMQGPYNYSKFQIGDLIANHELVVPESEVVFTEGGRGATMAAASSPNHRNSARRHLSNPRSGEQITPERTLYWLKGIKAEVLDERDRVMPTAEFFCHFTVDLNPHRHNELFSHGERCSYGRLFTLTQGQLEILFPEGFGVPVASDEELTMMFQAVNRTTSEHRRVKHRLSFYFIKDSTLSHPLKALHWQIPYMSTLVDKNDSQLADSANKQNLPDCSGGSVCPAIPRINPLFVRPDSKGRQRAGHWLVPPGVHTYNEPIADNNQIFWNRPSSAHLVWTHVHPLCSEISLIRCEGAKRQKLFTVKAKTKTVPGLQLESIELLSSKDGISMPQGGSYEMEAIYNNTTGQTQDSMASFGIFLADDKFSYPDWADRTKKAASRPAGL